MRARSKLSSCCLGACLWLLVTGAAAAADLPPGFERGPYLQQGTPTSMTVRWRTETASVGRLVYGPAPDDLSFVLDEPASGTEHELTAEGLAPDTTYYYGVGTASGLLAGGDDAHFFVTSPLPGSTDPIRIWVIGDSGQCSVTTKGCDDAHAVKNRFLEYAGENIADVWLALGDNAYNDGTDQEYTEAVFEVYPEILRNTVLWPVPGNHEYRSISDAWPYYAAFTLPTQAEAGGVESGSERYYSFTYGNVHFVALDSFGTERCEECAMYQWLEADLAANESDWLIAYWHHPPYTRGSNNSDSPPRMTDMREIFVPLLERYGLDLQLTGHSHSYERSMLIDGHYGMSDTFDPLLHVVDGGDGDAGAGGDGPYEKPAVDVSPNQGAVYSVVGSSSKNSGDLDVHPVMVAGENYEGSMVIDIHGSVLEGVFIDKEGAEPDRFRIVEVPEPSARWMQVASLVTLLGVQLRARRGTEAR